MNKLGIIILIFLFAATEASFAGSDQGSDDGRANTAGATVGFFKDNSSSTRSTAGESSGGADGFFRATTAADPPSPDGGDRPGSGGIGQEAPLGDGMIVLICCGFVLIIMKIFKAKRKKQAA